MGIIFLVALGVGIGGIGMYWLNGAKPEKVLFAGKLLEKIQHALDERRKDRM